MIWRRLKNLWKLSEYVPNKKSDPFRVLPEFTKDPEIGRNKKQRLATVMQDEPLEVFEEENDKTN